MKVNENVIAEEILAFKKDFWKMFEDNTVRIGIVNMVLIPVMVLIGIITLTWSWIMVNYYNNLSPYVYLGTIALVMALIIIILCLAVFVVRRVAKKYDFRNWGWPRYCAEVLGITCMIMGLLFVLMCG